MAKQPGSEKHLNPSEFLRIRENLKYRRMAEEYNAPKGHYLPQEMGLFLTGRCNLRCRHCFEWNEDGFLSNGEPDCAGRDLPIEKIRECLAYTKPAKTRLYLWGGEPLMYSRFHELCDLLEQDQRWTVICTNGLLMEQRLPDLTKISDHLVLLVSLDGLREYNDRIRGKGTFDRVISGIEALQKRKAAGTFHGEISVCCVISDDMIGHLYEFCEFMETLEINTLYLSFPWYIGEEAAAKMDEAFDRRFSDLLPRDKNVQASWHHFTWHISPENSLRLKEEMKRISERTWKIRVRYQPAVAPEEIDDFIGGGAKTVQERTRCLSVSNRVDILQNGEVCVCKLFREFTVGNLNDTPLAGIWEGEKMAEVRKRLQEQLMPVCSKCVLLYLNGV